MKTIFFLLILVLPSISHAEEPRLSDEAFMKKFTNETEKKQSMQDQKIQFGDNVNIISSPETERLGLANKHGQVYGETTPSITQIEVIGELTDDYALNVFIEDMDEGFWLAPNLLEFIDNGPGTEISIGDKHAIKQEDGSWKEINK